MAKRTVFVEAWWPPYMIPRYVNWCNAVHEWAAANGAVVNRIQYHPYLGKTRIVFTKSTHAVLFKLFHG